MVNGDAGVLVTGRAQAPHVELYSEAGLSEAETLSFSAAAQRLNFTQSAVSQQIATLEADLGTPLLTRRPVALTPAGERLHRHATLILVRLAAARADVIRAVAPPGPAGTSP